MTARPARALGVLLAAAVLAAPAAAQQKPSKPAAAASAAAASAPTTGGKAGYAQRYAEVCAACHGANGRSEMQGTPSLDGQPSMYVITQLFLFREGRRDNSAMTAVAKGMTDDDMRGFSDFIGTLPALPPKPPAAPPDAARMSQGQALAQQHKCFFCHGQDLKGGQQVPHIAGQREEYLQAALQGFKSGQRPGYTRAMTEAVSQITPEELDTLAWFAARYTGPGK